MAGHVPAIHVFDIQPAIRVFAIVNVESWMPAPSGSTRGRGHDEEWGP